MFLNLFGGPFSAPETIFCFAHIGHGPTTKYQHARYLHAPLRKTTRKILTCCNAMMNSGLLIQEKQAHKADTCVSYGGSAQ